MALIKCPECGKEISDKAKVCINCCLLYTSIPFSGRPFSLWAALSAEC